VNQLMSGRMGRPLVVASLGALLGLAVVGALLATSVDRSGQDVAAQVAPPADPGDRGPYRFSATRRTFVRPSSATGELRALETVIWYPAAATARLDRPDEQLGIPVDAEPERKSAPYPVIFFSHGARGEPWQSSFLTRHLASHGFVVIAPPHPGEPDSWAERPDDVVAAMDQALGLSMGDDPLLAKLLDGDRVGVTGYSFGASTALVTMARDRRIRAAVAMAPASFGEVLEAVSMIDGPTMLMGGRLDHVAPFDQQQTLYGALPTSSHERWLIDFPRAGHGAYTDRCQSGWPGCGPNDLPQDRAHALIKRWATPFLLHHVGGDDRYVRLLDPTLAEGDPDLRISTERAPRVGIQGAYPGLTVHVGPILDLEYTW
jgi:predicted dienelactone hydrolase